MQSPTEYRRPASSEEPTYKGWRELAGYFDGDGTVEFSIKDSRVLIRLAFDDNWKPFLEGIRFFLLARGVVPGSVRQKEQSKTYRVAISGIDSVILMAKKMIPYVVKKRKELEAVIAYLGDHSTGQEIVEIMNEEVRQGQRTGKLRPRPPAYKRKRRGKAVHYVLV